MTGNTEALESALDIYSKWEQSFAAEQESLADSQEDCKDAQKDQLEQTPSCEEIQEISSMDRLYLYEYYSKTWNISMQASSKSHMCVLLMSHPHTPAASFSVKSSGRSFVFLVPALFLQTLGDFKQLEMILEFMLNQEALKKKLGAWILGINCFWYG